MIVDFLFSLTCSSLYLLKGWIKRRGWL